MISTTTVVTRTHLSVTLWYIACVVQHKNIICQKEGNFTCLELNVYMTYCRLPPRCECSSEMLRGIDW